jgi:hypothetical protein
MLISTTCTSPSVTSYLKRALLAVPIPSGGWPHRAARRRVTIIAALAIRNQCSYLPGFVRNVGPHVDGIVALDDGSRDGSGDFLAGCAEVIELIRVRPDRPTWDEMGNHRALVAAALRHRADWVISLDADERVEVDFRDRAERIIRRGSVAGLSTYALRIRDLWDHPGRYRNDGIWGRKRVARLFRARADHQFDTRPLHGVKAPLQDRIHGMFPCADLNIYHLGMLRREDRLARRQRYHILDPNCQWQPTIGYDYLTDEAGLELREISPHRDYRRVTEKGA